jgi:hypothetical protein
LPQVSAAQELQTKAQIRLASLIEEKLVTRISVLSTLLGGGKTTELRTSFVASSNILISHRPKEIVQWQ